MLSAELRPLFTHPVFAQEAGEFEQALGNKYAKALNDKNNLPQSNWDETILSLVQRTPGFIHPQLLKNMGSANLRTDFYEPIFAKQVERGHLNPSQEKELLADIKSNKFRLFFADFWVGFLTHYGLETLAIPLVFWGAHSTGNSEHALAITGYFKAANFLAMPWFAGRSIFEFKYLLNQIKSEDKNLFQKAKRLAVGTSMLTASVLLNAIPGASASTTPLLNYERYKEFVKPLLRNQIDNLLDLGKTARSNFPRK